MGLLRYLRGHFRIKEYKEMKVDRVLRDARTGYEYPLDELVESHNACLPIGSDNIDNAPLDLVDGEHGIFEFDEDGYLSYLNLSPKGTVIIRNENAFKTRIINLYEGDSSSIKEGDALHPGSSDNPADAYGPLYYLIDPPLIFYHKKGYSNVFSP